MKNQLFIPILLLLFALINSCTQSSEGYIIKGNLENGNGKIILMNELNTTSLDLIDSVKIEDDGSFLFEGKTSSPMFLFFQMGNNNFITLVVDSLDNIEVTGDANNLAGTYNVKGSKDSELIRELNMRLSKTLLQVDSIAAIFNQNKENPSIDSIKAELDKTYAQIIAKHKEFVTSFLDKNTESLACIMALYQQVRRNPILNAVQDIEYFEKVDNALSKKYPQSKHTKALHANVIEVKKVIASEQSKPQDASIGAIAPEITLPTPTGEMMSLSSLRGKYVLLDFWAGWCRPCRMESPNLVANYKKFHSKGFEIFQVSLDKTKDEWTKAIEKDGLNWNHVSDLQYWNSTAVKTYGVGSIPASFLIDKDGKIIAKDLRGDALGQKLAEIFN
ncbi:MAG TPA: hypothetical protein DDX39_11870 [Bacteroidales bacterium]|nr:MAG: hypothetical protein A2W98_10245 [Bacteroidetes bacterium GWF2_33_38]OFY75666.1 MAG: hypothetical protein A2265_11710 [Bacteroidetes bacterium RIFOXYA12_FULL_33_9]HBF89329.1 hypothetical protein [Bacteroidales bacterium]